MTRRQSERRYLSYLLRLWQTSGGNNQVWTASLENPGTEEHQGFASLKELSGFLQAHTALQDEERIGKNRQG